MRDLFCSVACLVFLVVLLVSPSSSDPSNGCLWDRDTLRAEAEGLPGVVEVIVGRFDRYPDLYYEMRLDRVAREIETSPDDLGLYDDAGVACDRLGRSDEAIEWMVRKLVAMERLEAAGHDTGEHRYRYLANLGTFYIHRWLKNGVDRADMLDVQLARDLIAEAIELNPEAHFGREPVQLLAIEWILNPVTDDDHRYDRYGYASGLIIGSTIETDSFDNTDERWLRLSEIVDSLGTPDGVEGLSGLVTLGAAWQSVDIYASLAAALRRSGNQTTSFLAGLRVKELLESGKGSLHPLAAAPSEIEVSFGRGSLATKGLPKFYERARAEADRRHEARERFILAGLHEGRHPDTDEQFWDAWGEPSRMPALPNGFLGLGLTFRSEYFIVLGLAGLLVALVASRVIKLRKQRLTSAAPRS